MLNKNFLFNHLYLMKGVSGKTQIRPKHKLGLYCCWIFMIPKLMSTIYWIFRAPCSRRRRLAYKLLTNRRLSKLIQKVVARSTSKSIALIHKLRFASHRVTDVASHHQRLKRHKVEHRQRLRWLNVVVRRSCSSIVSLKTLVARPDFRRTLTLPGSRAFV